MAELFSHEYFMQMALKEAQNAFDEGEVPIGCIIVCENKVLGKGHNLTETLNDVTAHAEMQTITAAANYLGAKYLNECALYVTVEPCVMCAGALYWSQLGQLVYGTKDDKRGFSKVGDLLHPKTTIINGVLENDAAELMKNFFKKLR